MNTDFSIIKRIPLSFREGVDIDFRAEFFNIFNHAQFGLPGSDVDTGRAISASLPCTVNNPRLIQFALKLRF